MQAKAIATNSEEQIYKDKNCIKVLEIVQNINKEGGKSKWKRKKEKRKEEKLKNKIKE